MRVFKKIMYIVLALVPILPLLLFAVCNVGNTNGKDIVPMGHFLCDAVEEGGQVQALIFVEKDTILYHVVSSAVPSNEYLTQGEVEISFGEAEYGLPTGIYAFYNYDIPVGGTVPFAVRAVLLYSWFASVGISPPAFVVYALLYLSYLFFIQFLFMIFDIVTFVPRKCSEIFGG